MKNWKVWKLFDVQGNLIAQGRKRDVVNIAYRRYVYSHIFNDALFQTDKPLK